MLERLGFEVAAASSVGEALAMFDAGAFDLVLTDIRMPGMDGHAFLRAIRERNGDIPIVVVTGQATLDTAIAVLREGASGMLVKPFTAEEFVAELATVLERARIRHDAIQYRFVTPILDGVALALTAAIEARHLETGDHCRQLGRLGDRIARLLGLPEQDCTTIRIGGYLHDVGKIAIPDRILLKPGPLTPEEMVEMRRHSDIGASIVETHEAMAGIAKVVRHHHERWDGDGYPGRLAGRDIPLGARIISVVDAWSAMTCDRVYRGRLSVDESAAELRRNAGRQFDPELVEVFLTDLEDPAVLAPAIAAAPMPAPPDVPSVAAASYDTPSIVARVGATGAARIAGQPRPTDS
jgi:putative nucleotidyltransferase with HDIG domain